MKIKAKAKVNLILKVVNKRNDGYHNLQMLNTRINLYDTIYISKSNTEDKLIYVDHPEYDTSSNNLILKTLKNFKTNFNIKSNYLIKIKKRIPFGAGLGGASMDAGEVIKAVCKIEHIYIEKPKLVNYLKNFGADIPYSLYNTPCIVEGIGDIITPIQVEHQKFVLICPNIYVDTTTIFKEYKKQHQPSKTTNIIDDVKNKNYYNDLQKTAYEYSPELKKLSNQISHYGKITMSGSGSALILDTAENKSEVVSKLKKDYPLYIIKIIKIKSK